MKIVIFAGGVGTRLWPLSRKITPKQFEKIIGERSTLQETVQRLLPEFSTKDIFIATGKRYETILKDQLPQIPHENFIFEPEMRDVGPAIGLVSVILEKKIQDEPVAILWSDHLVKHIDTFKHVLSVAEQMIKTHSQDFVFIGQKPRFANQNIGWIELGEKIKEADSANIYTFKKLRYRPKLSEALNFYENNNFVWNLGYFVTTPTFLVSLYAYHAPEMHRKLKSIGEASGTAAFESILTSVYPTLEKVSFDDIILEKLTSSKIAVISADLGWSDIGAWEALKEALAKSVDENVTRGNILIEDSRDSLVFNYTNQLLVGMDLQEMLVINTEDVVLVCPKTSVPKIKKLVESLAGTPHEHLT